LTDLLLFLQFSVDFQPVFDEEQVANGCFFMLMAYVACLQGFVIR